MDNASLVENGGSGRPTKLPYWWTSYSLDFEDLPKGRSRRVSSIGFQRGLLVVLEDPDRWRSGAHWDWLGLLGGQRGAESGFG